MSHLFTPITLGDVTLSNRIVVAPMCQYSADNGLATSWHMMHLGHLAMSGAGMLTIEATAVSPEGRITEGDLGLWSDAHRDALKPVVDAIRHYSNLPLSIQLGHAGRKASCNVPWKGGSSIAPDQTGGWQTWAPSALPFAEGDPVPTALNEDDIKTLKADFVAAAQRAASLGIDVIELHAAHGYLLHEFLSPLSNHREDGYGGTLENRLRLVLEVFDAVKEAIPAQMALGVRVSAEDWVEGGWDTDQTIALAKALEARGCHFIHVSSGGLSEHQQITAGPNYQVPMASRIKSSVDMPVIAVGLITEPEQAEAIIGTGQADMVGLARAMLFNPRWPWHAAAALKAQVRVPPQYERSEPHALKGLFSQ
ncbi:NADH:flavin oxidoreductase/NADH oxidase [Larsenimonas rhizosphaerae]|uniref:NADH:flavin oxidoreductase/NADH oxidase n=1 Tax=Larsenimonas rhizosphaerae TaxID=2944682 RepID=A0AA41ZHR0_9GAMM|nr:NADH:flavin oxidoreductase/NADH oxidase [Larsenimonas rhizosphaerae]MCX2524982.1 NADH:flavin oxidoreductase/NADH oxidase [Larsenimonas rhizosphaerae]